MTEVLENQLLFKFPCVEGHIYLFRPNTRLVSACDWGACCCAEYLVCASEPTLFSQPVYMRSCIDSTDCGTWV